MRKIGIASIAKDPKDELSVGTSRHPITCKPSCSARASIASTALSGFSEGRKAMPAA